MDASLATEDMIRAIQLDKKTLGGRMRLALPRGIGECSVTQISREALAGAIDAHREWRP
jgi:3-dehydroquinate synthetase